LSKAGLRAIKAILNFQEDKEEGVMKGGSMESVFLGAAGIRKPKKISRGGGEGNILDVQPENRAIVLKKELQRKYPKEPTRIEIDKSDCQEGGTTAGAYGKKRSSGTSPAALFFAASGGNNGREEPCKEATT